MRPRERDVESYFVRQVEAAGAFTRKCRWLCRRGAPDRYAFGFINGDAWCEIKRPGEKPDAHQQRELNRMRAAGLRVYVLDSFEAVDRFIEEMTA